MLYCGFIVWEGAARVGIWESGEGSKGATGLSVSLVNHGDKKKTLTVASFDCVKKRSEILPCNRDSRRYKG